MGVEITLKGQQQPNLKAFAAHRKKWELSKMVIEQSEIRWAISTFKTFKVAVTDGTVPALLEQEADHLMTHPRCIF